MKHKNLTPDELERFKLINLTEFSTSSPLIAIASTLL